ncbi:DUF4352 domain-containing protein [Tetragenococcus halophilus]|nr:DUF4352 domain-containing protein [Tetragenococcus halophilus]AOF49326.1 hypothetical protein AC806_08040 [Tetragenococcus halophilus]AYW51039.1 DUF4352 domain-containing protein [Tetragenococcus halophilus]MCF1675935.1 DUF4352 domain-containing protein [Tetragenococcus halophilus]MCO8284448.1 DUF4352 domain-containing protein [Tetragenococcus halophilus]MCO8288331.1 DUF4352 domain-containing protein [Tetragenococcus halophilus]
MKKRNVIKLVMLASTLALAGCGGSDNNAEEDNSEGKTEDATVKINQGDYVLQDGETVEDGEGYLALNVGIKNNTEETLQVSASELSLYDSDDNQISNADIYTDDDDFEMFRGTNLSGGKSTSGYVVFKVDKDKKYNLQYAPTASQDEEADAEEVEIALDPSDYNDPSEDVQEVMDQYISQVFLADENTEDSDSDTQVQLENNTEEEHADFNQSFIDELKNEFDAYSPSDGELQKAVEAFEKTNQEKANVEYTMASLTPTHASVYVKPEVIDFNKIDFEAITNKFVDENKGKYDDYEKAQQDAEKYILQELPEQLNEEDVEQPQYMSADGYKINLTQEDGTWTVDTSDSNDNYDYKGLISGFMGGLGDQ